MEGREAPSISIIFLTRFLLGKSKMVCLLLLELLPQTINAAYIVVTTFFFPNSLTNISYRIASSFQNNHSLPYVQVQPWHLENRV